VLESVCRSELDVCAIGAPGTVDSGDRALRDGGGGSERSHRRYKPESPTPARAEPQAGAQRDRGGDDGRKKIRYGRSPQPLRRR
jgi:hypothetical protein